MYINRQDTGIEKKENAGLYLAPPIYQLTKIMSHIIMLSSIALIPSYHAFNWSTDR